MNPADDDTVPHSHSPEYSGDLEPDAITSFLDLPENVEPRGGHRTTLAPKPEIQRLSHAHDQIINWLLVNPHLKLKDCADYFGYSQAWLSIIIHSDCFQARLKEKQDLLFGATVGTIQEKLTGIAHVGLDKLADKLEEATDVKTIHEVTKTALDKLGFGQPRPAPTTANTSNTQNNFYVASSADLVAAREKMLQVGTVSPTPQLNSPSDATPFSGPTPPGEAIPQLPPTTPEGEQA